MDKMEEKRSSTSATHNLLGIVGPWLSQLRSNMLHLIGNSTDQCTGTQRKAKWPFSYPLRVDEIPFSRTLVWKVEWPSSSTCFSFSL